MRKSVGKCQIYHKILKILPSIWDISTLKKPFMSILCCQKAFKIIKKCNIIFEHGFDPHPPFEQCAFRRGRFPWKVWRVKNILPSDFYPCPAPPCTSLIIIIGIWCVSAHLVCSSGMWVLKHEVTPWSVLLGDTIPVLGQFHFLRHHRYHRHPSSPLSSSQSSPPSYS